jgi:hypothetical protein
MTLWARCVVVGIAENVEKERLRWRGHVIRHDEEMPVRDVME